MRFLVFGAAGAQGGAVARTLAESGCARAAGVRRLVFNTGNRLPDRDTGVAAFDTRRAAVRALRASGLPVVVLRPALYLENLLAPAVMADGVLRYPLPAALPIAWLGHADLAALTAAALTGGGPAAGELDAGGPAAMTGAALAAAFGLRYEEQDVAAFEAGLAGVLGAATAAEVAATYRWIASAAPPSLLGPGPSLGVRLTTAAAWAADR